MALYSENAGAVGAGIASADVLASPELATKTLATSIRDALELLQPFDEDEETIARIAAKVGEARGEYEALKTKLA